MQPDRLTVLSVAGFVTLAALATGPQLGLLSIPPGDFGGQADPGTGSAVLTVVSAPDTATLSADQYGEVHYLRVPETSVSASGVTGAPLLTMSVSIGALGFQRSSVYEVADRGPTTRNYAVERVAIESDRIEREVYQGTLRIALQDDRGRTVLYEEPIPVQVTE